MLNKHNLSIAALASKDSSRYALGGIQIRPDRTEATDGHLAIVVDTPKNIPDTDFPAIDGFTQAETFTPFILPAKDALEICKAIPKAKLPVLRNTIIGEQTNSNGTAFFAVTDLESPKVFNPRKIDMVWPNLDLVMPDKDKSKLTISFNAVLLSNLLKVMGTMADDDCSTVTFSFTDNVSPARIDCSNTETGQTVKAAIMPVKVK